MKRKRKRASSDATLIDASVIATATEEIQRGRGEDRGVFATEPELTSFLDDRLHVIAGKLSLAGAGTEIVNGVFSDVRQLLVLASTIVRTADRALINDLLPHPDGRVRTPEQDQNREDQ